MGVQTMNSAYIKMVKREARKARRAEIVARICCWTILATGAVFGAALYFVFVFMFLSLGG